MADIKTAFKGGTGQGKPPKPKPGPDELD